MKWIQRLSVAQRFNVLICLVFIAAAVPAYFFFQLQTAAIKTTQEEVRGIPEAQLAIGALTSLAASQADSTSAGSAVSLLEQLASQVRSQRPDLAVMVDAWVSGAKTLAQSGGRGSLDKAKKGGFGVRDALLDASTLSLDPEAHTYNLMVFATVQVPGLSVSLYELEAFAKSVVRRGTAGSDDRYTLLALSAQAQDQAESLLSQAVKVEGLVGEKAKELTALAREAHAVSQKLNPLVTNAVSGPSVDAKALAAAVDPMLGIHQSLSALEDKSWLLLNELLLGRQGQLQATLLEVSAIVIFVVVLACGLAYAGSQSIRRQLGAEPREVLAALDQVAKGNLAADIQKFSPPQGSILAGVDTMQKTLSSMVLRLSDSADKLAEATSQLAAGQSDLSSRTERQASALEETSASTEQLLATIRQNLDQVDFADTQGAQAKQSVNDGSREVESIVQTMQSISEASRRVMDITGSIDSIAFQTNILALNAAVEAARAGEQGRGFAVVASEVRALAQRAAVSAKEIKALIDASIHTVDQGTDLVGQTGSTMLRVVEQVGVVGRCMSEIRTAATEQSEGIQQVNAAVTEMDQLTQQNAAMVEEMAATAGALAEEAEALREIVGYFKLAGRQNLVVA